MVKARAKYAGSGMMYGNMKPARLEHGEIVPGGSRRWAQMHPSRRQGLSYRQRLYR